VFFLFLSLFRGLFAPGIIIGKFGRAVKFSDFFLEEHTKFQFFNVILTETISEQKARLSYDFCPFFLRAKICTIRLE